MHQLQQQDMEKFIKNYTNLYKKDLFEKKYKNKYNNDLAN